MHVQVRHGCVVPTGVARPLAYDFPLKGKVILEAPVCAPNRGRHVGNPAKMHDNA